MDVGCARPAERDHRPSPLAKKRFSAKDASRLHTDSFCLPSGQAEISCLSWPAGRSINEGWQILSKIEIRVSGFRCRVSQASHLRSYAGQAGGRDVPPLKKGDRGI